MLQNFRLALPPPVERHPKPVPAMVLQNGSDEMAPPSHVSGAKTPPSHVHRHRHGRVGHVTTALDDAGGLASLLTDLPPTVGSA